MKKGFTLMEILFVLLVIALVVSFATPVIRSVRYDVYNARAKTALRKLAEARRSYYQYTKGSDIVGAFSASVAKDYASYTCNNVAASGIPGSQTLSDVSQLFACGFLDWKDFSDLPYNFAVCGPYSRPIGSLPCVALGGNPTSEVYAGAMGMEEAGDKYKNTTGYYMSVARDMQVRDSLE